MSSGENELISPSGKYKAKVVENDERNSVDIYIFNEDFNPVSNNTNEENWLRKNSSPIIIEKGLHTGAFAIEELRKLMGEPDIPLTINWIKDFSFCKDATFIDPKEVNVYCNFIDQESKEQKLDKIDVKLIIKFDGLCLVEEIGDEDDWQMGQIDSKGDIYCWGYYGTLKEAIRAL